MTTKHRNDDEELNISDMVEDNANQVVVAAIPQQQLWKQLSFKRNNQSKLI